MAILRLSTQMKKAWNQGFANVTNSSSTFGNHCYNYGYSNYLMIWGNTPYGGSVPDSNHKLVQIDLTNAVSTDGSDEFITYSSSAMASATRTGTANWFTINQQHTHDYFAYGTVGIAGSGADLMIGSTSIVSGTQYNFSNIVFKFPSAI